MKPPLREAGNSLYKDPFQGWRRPKTTAEAATKGTYNRCQRRSYEKRTLSKATDVPKKNKAAAAIREV